MLHKTSLYYVSLLFKRLAIVYLLFATCRVLFYTYNVSSFSGIRPGELGFLFIVALRFDTSSILYANAVVVLMHLLPFSLRGAKWYQKTLKGVFFISNGCVLFFEIADVAYYPYAFRRMLRSDFDMGTDIQNLIPQFISEFWGLIIVYFFLMYIARYLYNKTGKKNIGPLTVVPQFILFILFSGLTVIGMRGGLQLRPIMPIVASRYVSNVQYMPLVSNATLGLIHSFFQREVGYKNYFDKNTLERIYSLDKKVNRDSFYKKNVVILVCESLGREYIGFFEKGESHSPFLDSMLGEGMNFVNMYANGTRSTQGVAAINGSLPALMVDPFVFSAYQNNNITGLGDLLLKEGYTNAFFHGGEVGTMGFDHFMPTVGVTNYYGRQHYIEENNYSKNKDYDGNWGIWDIPFYDYALKKIGNFEPPFFATLLSINVHHPFNVEPWFAGQYTNINKRLRAIKYADHNLRVFFEKASKEAWFGNTLFVITADHTGPNRSAEYIHREGCYRIPLLLYCPSDSILRGEREEVTQQIDIMPTVLGYLGYSKAFKSFGVNKFDSNNTQHYSYTFEKDIYQIIGKEFVLQFDGEKSIALYNRITDIYLKNNILNKHPHITTELERQLKAVIQVHNRVLIENKY